MRTNIFSPKKDRVILQGDDSLIFEKGMKIALPYEGIKAEVGEVVFVLTKPTKDSDMVSISQEVFLKNEEE